MYVVDGFTSEWEHLYHQSMGMDSDAFFFYGIHVRLCRLAEQNAQVFDVSVGRGSMFFIMAGLWNCY